MIAVNRLPACTDNPKQFVADDLFDLREFVVVYKQENPFAFAPGPREVGNYVITTGSNPGAPVTYGHFGPTAQAPYTISGTVRDAQNQPVSGVTVTLSGGAGGQVTTGGNGQYSFTNLQFGDYTLTPSKSGFVFNPGSITYLNLQRNKTGTDFTALPPIQTVYDKKVNYSYNAVGALAGVGTNLIGSDPNNTTNVLNTLSFRSSGALSSLHYGNGRRLTMGYNDQRSQPTSMKVDRVTNSADKIIDYQYEYYTTNPLTGQNVNNNRIRKITDNVDPQYTTTYSYDDFNRLKEANWTGDGRFYQYDAWGNIKSVNFGLTYNYAASANGAPATNRLESVALNGVTQTSYS